MDSADLLEQMLIDMNFKKPYEVRRDHGAVVVRHRSDSIYLVFWFRNNDLMSKIKAYPYLRSGSNRIEFIRPVYLCAARNHGNIHEPQMFENLRKSLLKFVSTTPERWIAFLKRHCEATQRTQFLGLATAEEFREQQAELYE